MADASVPFIPRAPLALRVGVTGTRHLTPDAAEALRPAVADILAALARETARLAEDARTQGVYAEGGPVLRLLSPLAEGGDRLVAEEGPKAGYALFSPLPFPQAQYEEDFPQTVGAFRALLAQGETLELDGERGAFAPESYREVGRFVVRNCDLLIAIWDGARESGPGGTAEIVRYAVRAGLPVWRIDSAGGEPPCFIESPQQLQGGAATGEAAAGRLARYLEQIVVPPLAPPAEHGEGLVMIAQSLSRLFSPARSPLEDYLAEKPLRDGFPWRAFAWMMRRIAPAEAREMPALDPPSTRAGQWWDKLYRAADEVSIDYGDRYRSSYVWIAFLAFVALAGAGLAHVLPNAGEDGASGLAHFLRHRGEAVAVGVEMLSLFGIFWLVTLNQLHRWHEKWISYRLLAELCRKQYVLSSIGRVLPGSEVLRLSEAGAGAQLPPRDAWVAWYFSAAQRAAPLPLGSYAALKPAARQLALSLAREQDAYHEVREARSLEAGRNIARLGEICFVLTVIVGAVKFGLLFGGPEHALKWATATGACLSAASGAFVGVRAYSEFSLLARQSAHMRRMMKGAAAEFSAIDPDEPLAGRELGRALYALALSMMQEISGWAQLFRIKTLEAGG